MVLRFSSAGPKCDSGGVLISLVLAAALAAVPVAVGAAAVVPCARVDAAFGCRLISGMNYESMKQFDPNLSADPGCHANCWTPEAGLSLKAFRMLFLLTTVQESSAVWLL